MYGRVIPVFAKLLGNVFLIKVVINANTNIYKGLADDNHYK